MSNREIMGLHENNILLIDDNPGDVELASIMLAGSKAAAFHLESRERLATGLERVAREELTPCCSISVCPTVRD